MRPITLVLGLIALPLTAAAHHTVVRFDREQIVELEGEITDVLWRNPHVRLELRTEDGRTWDIETNSVSNLSRLDIPADILQAGDRVRLAGNPERSGDTEMFARHALLPDGREVVLSANQSPRWSNNVVGSPTLFGRIKEGDGSRPELGLFRVWTTAPGAPGSFPFHPPDDPEPLPAEDYPLTESARAALESFDPVRDAVTQGCEPKGMPTIVDTPYPQEFVDEGDRILHRIEEYDTTRVIHMADAPPASEVAPSLLGHSVGRWEGDTLVVRTIKVNWGHFNLAGIPLTENAVFVERFTPSDDGSRLDYRITVTDPAIFTESVVLERHWIWLPDAEVRAYECVSSGEQTP